MNIKDRLAELGLKLPTNTPPIANYLPYKRSGNLIFISGQICLQDNVVTHKGKVKRDCPVAKAREAALVCGLNILYQLYSACEEDQQIKVKQCVKLGVFINCDSDFQEHSKIADVISLLLINVFGDAGKHSRFAVGVNSLPLDSSVEAEAIFEIE